VCSGVRIILELGTASGFIYFGHLKKEAEKEWRRTHTRTKNKLEEEEE